MNQESSNNRRVAKNTLVLYLRMIVLTLISLYTSRAILQVLGVDDYGLYNVVGGVVSMFVILTGTLSNAISRFITYELGKGNREKLSITFCTSVNILIVLSLVIAVMIAIFGGWFLNGYMNIPQERLMAANWVFYCAIVTFVLNVMSVPYNASIIAHEKMSAFAYISILEVSLKLGVVFALYASPVDKLITYAILLMLVAVLIRCIYAHYCVQHFEECRYRLIHDKSLVKEMASFAGWNFVGTTAHILNTHGINIITNLFFGVAVNAARGVAGSVQSLTRLFVTSFSSAIIPQITKSYAQGKIDYMYALVCKGSKYAFLLTMFILIPFLFEAETILHLWLGVVPEHATLFVRLTILITMFGVMGEPMIFAVFATGRVKTYYSILIFNNLMVMPVSYVLFRMGCPAYTSYVVIVITEGSLLLVRLYVFKKELQLSLSKYNREVFARIIPVTICSICPVIGIYYTMPPTLFRMFIIVLVSSISILIFTYIIGIEYEEKQVINNSIKKIFSNLMI